MSPTAFDPELDLKISRVIAAPRRAVWDAWADPRSLEQWWIPAPAKCRVVDLELRPGGAFRTEMSMDEAAFQPHIDGCFLAAEEEERIVFTTALDGSWRPAGDGLLITAEIALSDHPDGTEYSAIVRHRDRAGRDQHDDMGFEEGWGTAIGQLSGFVGSRT